MLAAALDVTPPAAPTSGATVVLYTQGSESPQPFIRPMRVTINFLSVDQASAANGLKAYAKSTSAGTWRQLDFNATMPVAIAASSAGVDDIHDFDVVPYKYFKVEYTAGATPPSTWELIIQQIYGSRDTGR